MDQLYWIIDRPKCDKGTASLIFWRAGVRAMRSIQYKYSVDYTGSKDGTDYHGSICATDYGRLVPVFMVQLVPL